MKKINKLILVFKNYGIFGALKKIYYYLKLHYFSKFNLFEYIYTLFLYNKISKNFTELLSISNYNRIIIWRSSFGWNVPLFQRPQHISRNLAKNNSLIFYETTKMTDNVKTIKKMENNLYLINLKNKLLAKIFFKELENNSNPKYIQFYSTDTTISLKTLKKYINNGYKIIYEYIDDLSPLLVGTKELPINIKEKYEYMLKDTENVFVVVTADEIEKDITSKRGKEKMVFSCNGVDYEHFNKIDNNFDFDKKFLNILNEKKPIIGYYGALASWFDYDLIKKIAIERPNYNIVLLGIKYDDSFDKANLNKYSNIHFLGSKNYDVLPNYASKFDVCTIPFLINDITQATSPLKLFEYMALGKPIVTTAMKECKKYEAVKIANNEEEFIKHIDQFINESKENNSDYFKLLHKEALENTWEKKSKLIIDLLKKYEN